MIITTEIYTWCLVSFGIVFIIMFFTIMSDPKFYKKYKETFKCDKCKEKNNAN